ncbi:MAG: Gfo/Idh/MocA family oxidoreductase [Siculibacillus sp.]|nr:Gfo/Idh/MocA family oxidoreductase [Siculibacillus sp.]
MTLKIGVLGFSEGNGHPLSFSAIVNGYDDEAFGRAGWPVIHAYLGRREADEFGFPDTTVTHVWCPDRAQAAAIAAACRIAEVVDDPAEMIGAVDAVMILRDDAASHRPLAAPFLAHGLPVFVDKPLCVTAEDLAFFRPHLESGRLMSCSGLRHARELDEVRANLADFGTISLVRASVVVDWARYGIHMLEAVMGALGRRPVAVQRHVARHESVAVTLDDGTLLLIDALGAVPKTFGIDIFGARRIERVEISDNFSAFRRTVARFIEQVRSGVPAIEPADTVRVIETLMAGAAAEPGGPRVPLP